MVLIYAMHYDNPSGFWSIGIRTKARRFSFRSAYTAHKGTSYWDTEQLKVLVDILVTTGRFDSKEIAITGSIWVDLPHGI